MSDLISVIIPVFNVENYLEECLESVLAQTYKNIEVILVDDGSSDGSGAICDAFATKDDRVKVIHAENGGVSAARNKGLDIATGNWVMFADSDDLLAADIVESLMRVIGDHQIAMCDRQDFDQEPSPVCDSDETIVYDSQTVFEKMYDQNQFMVVWGKLYRRELFETFRFREGIIHEDEDALPRVFWAAGGAIHLRSVKYFYRTRPGSIMTSEFSTARMDIIGVCQRRIDLFESWGLTDLRERAVKDYFLHLKRLEKQTRMPGLEKEHALVVDKQKQWRGYGVRFSLWEKLRMIF